MKQGSGIVARTNDALGKVATDSQKAGQLIGEIIAAPLPGAGPGDRPVSTAIAEMDRVVQQNAANSEESAAASEALNAQAEHLKEFVQQLVAIVDGAANEAGTGPPRSSRCADI